MQAAQGASRLRRKPEATLAPTRLSYRPFDRLVECFLSPSKGIPAMSAQMTPDQAKYLLALTLPTIKTEHATTMKVIQAIPLDEGDYRPEPVAKSALELAWHIVAAENRFLSGSFAGKFDFTPNHRPDSINN